MILTIRGIMILPLTFLRFLVAMVNMLSRPYLPANPKENWHLPSLSVLIPVRNEGKNFGTLHDIAAFYNIANLAGAKTAGRSYEWKSRKVA